MSIRKNIGTFVFWLSWPLIYFVLNNSHRSRVIISVDDKVLFVTNWIGDKKYSLPGGGIKKTETSRLAASREVYEETGIFIKPDDLIMVVEKLSQRDKGITCLIDCYRFSLKKTKSTSSHSPEILESRWLSYEKLINSKDISKNTNALLSAWLSKKDLIN